MIDKNDAIEAVKLLNLFCSEKHNCTNCEFRYAESGNCCYCGLTHNRHFNPELWWQFDESK